VRKMAMSVAGELHVQLGPAFRALILSSCGDTGSAKSQLESAFDENPFDPAASKLARSRECVVLQSTTGADSNAATATSVLLDLPKIDLPASLPSDCIEKMASLLFLRYRVVLLFFHFFLISFSYFSMHAGL